MLIIHRFSGVQRQASDYPPLQPSQGNKYMPPARRLPTSRPTVAGAPVDPAIISSQIARPESIVQDRKITTATSTKVDTNRSNSTEAGQAETPKESIRESKDVMPSNLRPLGNSKAPISSTSATTNVETEVLDSFRQFANLEKIKFTDSRRQRASHDKAIKLNDLMKFSKTFKLLTPVPKDLVPILAKDKSKQEEIMEKAQRNAESMMNTPPKLAALVTSGDLKPARPLAEAKYEGTKISPSAALVPSVSESQDYLPGRSVYPIQGSQATVPPRERHNQINNMPTPSPKAGQGLLGRRLEDSHRMYKVGLPVNVPAPLPIQSAPKGTSRSTANPPPVPSSQASSIARTPTSAASAKFNVKAMEFKPNPAANTFKPTGEPSTTSSPRATPNARPSSRAPSPTAFFGNKKPLPPTERLSILDNFNPLKRLKEKAQDDEGKLKDYASNGGIPHAYATPPTWKTFKDGEEYKSYKDMFDNLSQALTKVSSQQASPVNPPLPHQHQLPLHLQHGSYGVPQLHAPQQAPFPVQQQNHHYPNGPHHYDDHRMHLSASSSSVYPSPRLQNTNMAYPSPMAQPAQLAYGQPVPHYVMGPNGPQPTHFRQYAAGPPMVPGQGPQLAAPMMVQQSSQGGFVAPHGMSVPFNPQMPIYPPGQPTAYGGQPQAPNGYPSPGRGAPMMMHQGSHQGQQGQIYANPGQYGPPVYAQQPPPHSKFN